MDHHSTEFESFANYLGFKHRKITPRWPRANGEVERFMKTIKKVYRTAHTNGKPFKQELYRFLRNYRATPHSSTNEPPGKLMLNRSFRTRLPEVTIKSDDANVRQRDNNRKLQMKVYADAHENVNKHPIAIGDTVLVKREGHIPKQVSPYDTKPYQVSAKKGSMITATRSDHKITRNSSYFKVFKGQPPTQIDEEEENDIPADDANTAEATTPTSPAPRYPTRERKPPSYLQEYIT